MTLEAYVETQIVATAAVMAHFKTDANVQRPIEDFWFASSGLGLGDNPPIPPRPYMVWNELTDFVHSEVKETSNSRNRNFQWFVYDHKGDFSRINAILNDLRALVKGMGHFTTPDGIRCSASEWGGISGQATDDAYDSGVKFCTVRFTVNQ